MNRMSGDEGDYDFVMNEIANVGEMGVGSTFLPVKDTNFPPN